MQIGLSEHFTYKKLVKFTTPTIIMMIFTSVYGVVDGLFISNIVGEKAFAGVNLIMPVLMILGSVGFMFGTGGSALVSKTLGEGKERKANEYFSMLTYLLIIIGFIFVVAGIIFMEPIAIMLKADETILNDCVVYGRVLSVFLPAFLLQNSFQSFLIVAEKPKFGLIISVAAGFTNMILDFLFIYVFDMKVFGAALATGLSQVVGAIIPLIYFIKNKEAIIKLVKPVFELKAVLKTCGNGSSEMVTNLSMSLVNILFNVKLMELAGTDGVVAYGIIMYVSFIFIGVYLGYSIGTAPVIAYNYGAGNIDELKSLLSKSLKIITIVSLVLTIFAEIFAGMLASIFVSYDKELLEMTTTAIRLFSLSFFINGYNIFASSFFTALNNGFVSALISFLRTLVFQILAILIMPMIWGLNGIWLAVVVAEILAVGVSIICFIKNKDKYRYI